MSDALALLSAALFDDGYIAIRGFATETNKDKLPRQKFFAPGEYKAAADYAQWLSDNGWDAYFSTSTLKNTDNAEAANVESVACFKIDLDVGDDEKKYGTKREAVEAILHWCHENEFPAPVLVDSGNGVHGYWCLSEALDANSGKIYSEKIKQIWLTDGLKFDRTSTGDIARVLRIPGTLNYKQVPAKRVKLKTPVVSLTTDDVLGRIDALYTGPAITALAPAPNLLLGALPAHLRGIKLDRETEALILSKPKSMRVLLKKCMNGTGCAQITDIVGKQAQQDEPRWRAGLSVARFCDDGDVAIHNISNKHPGYSYDETEKKAAQLVGPYKCSTFESNWPTHCLNCPHKGKITSPIQLGDYVPLADKKDNVVLGQNKMVDDAEVAYTIPEYPFPYQRGKNGGVYKRNPEDEDNPIEVIRHDLYVVDRMRDPNDGYLVALRLHHPTDGVIDFTVDAKDVGSKEEFRSILNRFGIMKVDGGVVMVRQYVLSWMHDLEMKRAASMVRTQMGWTEGYKSFVIGDREVSATGKEYSRTAPSLAPVAKALSKIGELQEWRKTFNVYAMPGYEAYAFCALVGFGAPLMPLLDLEGLVINAYSQESGSGKTTTQFAALSIWGDPKGLIMTCGEDGDTSNARFNRMGQYKNLPICIDEATRLKPDDMFNLLLSTTQGRAKHRMSGSANVERANDSKWSTISLYSANVSFIDMLQTQKTGVDGALKRILEVHLPKQTLMTKSQSDAHFRHFFHNYGHAGEVYVNHLLKNFSRVLPMLEEERRKLDTATQASADERYWSAALACIIVGGVMAQEAGLHDIDMDKIRAFAVELVLRTRARHHFGSVISDRNIDVLGEFINSHNQNTVVVSVNKIEGKNVTTPLREVTSQKILARLEKNDGTMYVTKSALHSYMIERNVVLETFLKDLRDKGILVEDNKQKFLGEGTSNKGGNVRCYVFRLPPDELPDLI